MGISLRHLQTICNAIKSTGKELDKIKMIELGNQQLRKNCKVPFAISKEYFESIGVEHISMDMNGKDGALKKDLSKYIRGFKNKDIVTNIGTSEHVENQYWCFKNIHNFTKNKGVMIHVVPEVDSWEDHGLYHYTKHFFDVLAVDNSYKIISLESVGEKGKKLIEAVLQKTSTKSFIKEYEFDKTGIID